MNTYFRNPLSLLALSQLHVLLGPTSSPVKVERVSGPDGPQFALTALARSGRAATISLDALRLFEPDVLSGGHLTLPGERRSFSLAEYAADATIRQHLLWPLLQSLWRCPALAPLKQELAFLTGQQSVSLPSTPPEPLKDAGLWRYLSGMSRSLPTGLRVDYDPARPDRLQVWPHGIDQIDLRAVKALQQGTDLRLVMQVSDTHLDLELASGTQHLPHHASDHVLIELAGRALGLLNAVNTALHSYFDRAGHDLRDLNDHAFRTLLPVRSP